MTPEIVDPWDVERTVAEAGALDLAEAAVLADGAAGPDNSPATAMDDELSPRFVLVAPNPSLGPPLAQSAAACANSTAFAVALKAKSLAASVVSASSLDPSAFGAIGVPEGFTNSTATPATFAESTASAPVESLEFFAADSRSPDLADPVPAAEIVPFSGSVNSSPDSANAPDSPVCERSRTLLSATSDACRTAAFDESASFNARANDAEEFSSARAGLSALKGTA
jgi:hypothetical protein